MDKSYIFQGQAITVTSLLTLFPAIPHWFVARSALFTRK